MADPDLSQFMATDTGPDTGPDLSQFMTAPKPKAKVRDPSTGELLLTGVKKLPSSVGDLVKNTITSLDPRNYPAEGRAISSLVRGGFENLRGMDAPEYRGSAPPLATPREQTAAAAAGHQMVRPFTHPVHAFAEDPAGALASWSIPLGVEGAALKAAPVGALQSFGKVASTTADVMNPMGLAIKAAGAVPKLAAKVLPKGMSAEELAANMSRFDAAGVEPSYATVGGPLTQGAARITAKGPLSIGARGNFAKQIAQTGESVADTAAAYGNSTTKSLAGETLQGGIKRYVGDEATPGSFKAKVAGLYDAAFDPILKGEDAAVTKSEAAQAAKAGALKADHAASVEDARAAQRGEQMAAEQGMPVPVDQQTPTPLPPELPAAQPTTTTARTQSTLGDITSTINSPAIRNVIQDQRIPSLLDAIQKDPASVRFSDLRSLRTWVRNAQGNPDLILGVGQGNLQKLESALTEDIYANAQQFGGDAALNRLKRTDDYYRQGTQRIQEALQPFVNKTSGEGAYDRLLGIAGSTSRADVNSLFRLKRSLPPAEFGDVQASLIQNAGQVADGTGKMSFSPTKFVDWYGKLPDASKDILFGAGGSAAKAKPGAAALKAQLDNLVSVAANVAPLEKTAPLVGGASPYQSSVAVLGLLHPATILPEIAALTGEAGAAQILTSPKALKWITKLSAASAKGGELVAPLMKSLARLAKTDAQLQPVYQAANNILNPPSAKPAAGHEGFDPSQMTDEELKAAGGAPEAPAHVSEPGDESRVAMINSMTPQEAMALTIAGEASSDPHEMAGVGHVVSNRLASGKYGSTLAEVLKPEEFNVWENPAKLAELKGTPKYEAALKIADDVLAGKHADVTGGATKYYAPKALTELHKTQPEKYPHERPEWAQGSGTPLGESVFYP